MSKADVHTAIDETIVSNGKRAITAPSMANLLHLMADEGGGGIGGVLEVKLGTVTSGSDMTTSILSSEEREHNREVFRTIKEAAENGETIPLLVADYGSLLVNSQPEASVLINNIGMYINSFIYGYINAPALVSEIGYSEFVFAYGMIAIFLLLEDGSVMFDVQL